jgi:hypothetical protein
MILLSQKNSLRLEQDNPMAADCGNASRGFLHDVHDGGLEVDLVLIEMSQRNVGMAHKISLGARWKDGFF